MSYYRPNQPVIITGMLDEWPARSKWSLAYFGEHYGERDSGSAVRPRGRYRSTR